MWSSSACTDGGGTGGGGTPERNECHLFSIEGRLQSPSTTKVSVRPLSSHNMKTRLNKMASALFTDSCVKLPICLVFSIVIVIVISVYVCFFVILIIFVIHNFSAFIKYLLVSFLYRNSRYFVQSILILLFSIYRI